MDTITSIIRIINKVGILLALVAVASFAVGLTPGIAQNDSPVWHDEFDSDSLDPDWDWVKENPGAWNLTEQVGFLRIYAAPLPTGGETGGVNLLLRQVASNDFMIKTRVLFEPDTNFQFAGLVIWQNEYNFLQFGRAFCDVGDCVGNGIYFDKILNDQWLDGNFATTVGEASEAYLRLERRGEMVRGFYSGDEGTSWIEIGTHWIPPDFQVTGVGLTASQDYNTPEWDIPADFDFFELSEGGGFLPEGNHEFDSGEVLNWSCNAGGWAVDPDDRTARINVEIVVDHQAVVTMTAEEFREDLLEAGICDGGNCSFFHTLWGEMTSYEPHSVAVWAQDISAEERVLLPNSPKDITCRTYDIYTFDPRSGETTLVSNLPDMHEYNPKWSPDGRRVVHDAWSTDWSEHSLFISDIQTGVSTPIPGAERGSYPAWSPNGRWIAFDRGADNDYRLFIVSPGGGEPQLVVEDAFMASWAPNSQRLVYHQQSDGSLRTVKVDGSDQTQVTELGNGPSWSPNGQWIAYEVGGNLWKVRVNPQGVPLGEPMQLTNWSAWEGRPTWSSDSRTIVFHTDLAGDTDLWSIPAAGGKPTWLTGAPNSGDYDPNYANNNFRIAYAGGSPNGQAARTWVSAFVHDYGTWTVGDHAYHFEATWSGGGETTEEIGFSVSSEADLYPAYALLRPGAVRVSPDCQDVGMLHPDQQTRFLVGYLSEGELTYAEAQAFFEALEARAVWDEGESAQLVHREIMPFMPDNWWQYVCDFTDFPPDPYFTVFPEWEWFDGMDWPDGSFVNITVEDKPECEVIKQSWGGFFNGSFGEGCDIEIGNTVIFSNGEIIRTHTVRNLAINKVDMDNNTVFGTADGEAVIYVWPHATGEHIVATADGEGNWQANFSGQFDLVPRECGRSEVRDETGNATAVDWCAPNTRFTVFPEWNYLEGYEWPYGEVVSISVAGKEACSSNVEPGFPEGDPWNTFFSVNFSGDCLVEAGDLITLSSGSLNFTHQVPELFITEIDLDNDILTGTAIFDPELYVIHTWIHELDGSYMQLSAESGAWLADFGSQGFDLQPGMGGRVELVDQASNATAVEWYIPNPHFYVFPEWDYIIGWEWPAGTFVHAEVYHPNGNEGPDCVATAEMAHPEWSEEEYVAEFFLSETCDIQPGDFVYLTDGFLDREHIVFPLQVTTFDHGADIIGGIAEPGIEVNAWVHGEDSTFQVVMPDKDGNWMVDFSPFNLEPGMEGRVEQFDEDGDATSVDWSVSNLVQNSP